MIVARAKAPSRGLTVVAVLVCLIILTLISGAVLKVGLARRELARSQERRQQAEWLAESGTQRALARLARDRDYKGETWALSATELGQSERPPAGKPFAGTESSAAVITIAVEPLPAEKGRRRIRVQADYPPDLPRRLRHTKEITIDLDTKPTGAVP